MMACIGTVSSLNVDSEREEGEIVDELDDLSDISSEEEFLLRQRLQVLENYNNVLERKKAKRYGIGKKQEEGFLNFSDISEGELEDKYSHSIHKINKQNNSKPLQKKKKKAPELIGRLPRNKDKKKHHRSKKQQTVKIVSESSEESDDEYRNKRRKLANAVVVNRDKNDSSSLKTRLKKMLNGSQESESAKVASLDTEQIETHSTEPEITGNFIDLESEKNVKAEESCEITDKSINNENKVEHLEVCDLIDLCTDDEVNCKEAHDTVDSAEQPVKDDHKNIDVNSNKDLPRKDDHKNIDANSDENKNIDVNSDEDLELLRQHALKTKSAKNIPLPPIETNQPELRIHNLSDDEDSDTAELRMICLKSALLKKAIERKKKQKLKKRLSQCSTLNSDIMDINENSVNQDVGNNTDIESVDMDIGSDVEEKGKDIIDLNRMPSTQINCNEQSNSTNIITVTAKPNISINDDLDEDEDLLRAKLLTSLSKNLPNLVDSDMISNLDEIKNTLKLDPSSVNQHQPKLTTEEKKFIINLNESDSEGEHEATKNLTKMHIKLSEQVDFQQKLDLFLKSTRMQVENNNLPDVIQEPTMLPKPPEKFIPKAVNHLPKSEQIEYKNLVRKMAELEKIKQARQLSLSYMNRISANTKETLKPRNVSIEPSKHLDNLDDQIAFSRKKIAEESSKILKLKEEATKLSQKYKIVATELRNITTAITLNKKQQRAAQIKLAKIRSQHQVFLKRSDYKDARNLLLPNKFACFNRLQKENNPTKEEYKNPQMLKSLRVSVTNDLNNDVVLPNSRLSVQIDVNSNKKTIKVPRDQIKDQLDRNGQYANFDSTGITKNENDLLLVEKHGNLKNTNIEKEREEINKKETVNDRLGPKINDSSEYKSPLQALDGTFWSEDPNGVLCPFEISGNCKDSECHYLHPKIPTKP